MGELLRNKNHITVFSNTGNNNNSNNITFSLYFNIVLEL